MNSENEATNQNQETPDVQQEVVLSPKKLKIQALLADRLDRLNKAHEFGYRMMDDLLTGDKLSLVEVEKIIDDARIISSRLDGLGFWGGLLFAATEFEKNTERTDCTIEYLTRFDDFDTDIPF